MSRLYAIISTSEVPMALELQEFRRIMAQERQDRKNQRLKEMKESTSNPTDDLSTVAEDFRGHRRRGSRVCAAPIDE